jgi:hypothetical protein
VTFTAKPVVVVSEMDMDATIHSEGSTVQSFAELLPFIVLASVVLIALITGKSKIAFKGFLSLFKLVLDTFVFTIHKFGNISKSFANYRGKHPLVVLFGLMKLPFEVVSFFIGRLKRII